MTPTKPESILSEASPVRVSLVFAVGGLLVASAVGIFSQLSSIRSEMAVSLERSMDRMVSKELFQAQFDSLRRETLGKFDTFGASLSELKASVNQLANKTADGR